MRPIRIAAFVIVAMSGIVSAFHFYLLMAIFKPNAVVASVAFIHILVPFAMIVIGLSIQSNSKSAALRSIAAIGWSLLGWVSVRNLDDPFAVQGWRLVWFQPYSISIISWIFAAAFLFWAILERVARTPDLRTLEQRRLWYFGAFLGGILLVLGLVSTQRLLQSGNPSPQLIKSYPFMQNEYRWLANFFPFLFSSLMMFTSRGGKSQALLVGLSIVMIGCGFVIATAGIVPLVPDFDLKFDNFDDRDEPETFSGWIPVLILVAWYILPLCILVWGLDLLSPKNAPGPDDATT